MKRRNFLKKTSLATAAAFTIPYILPSGRLFAATGARKVNHVVFCLFAGGVRNLEAMQKSEGNLLTNLIDGTEPISGDIIGGMDPLPLLGGSALQNSGTLFKEFRYGLGPTGHYSAHTAAMTGVYTTTDLNIKAPPQFPTIFEYYRKHNSPATSALNAWWVSNALGPYPALNFSNDPKYGAGYGANYIQPLSLVNQAGFNVLGNPKSFDPSEAENTQSIKSLLDKNFGNRSLTGSSGIVNNPTDAEAIESFVQTTFQEATSGMYADPWGVGASMNNDMFNVFFAEKIIQEFQPELMVVNMQDVDIAHSNFTQYCNNLRKSDYALAHLWNTIQSTPGMANDTILIAAPEHGRNLATNTLQDGFGRFALDHTNDDMSREIFCLVLGPAGTVNQNLSIGSVEGQSIDIVPTMANILGFDSDIPMQYRNNMGQVLQQAFS